MTRKRNAIFLLLGILINLALVAGMTAQAEVNANIATEYIANSVKTLFLEDGRIVLAMKASSSEVSANVNSIVCMGKDGNVLWTCAVSDSDSSNPFLDMIELPDTTFAFLGKSSDDPYTVSLIDAQGRLLTEYDTPQGIYTPLLLQDGVYYVQLSKDSDVPCIRKIAWDGTISIFPCENAWSVNLLKGMKTKNDVYLSILYRNMDGQQMNAVLALDDKDGIRWQYTIGEFERGMIRAWTTNQHSGITVAVESTHNPGIDPSTSIQIVGLDEYGNIMMETTANAYQAVPHIISQATNGHYQIWGHLVDTLDQHHSFLLEIDAHGNFVSEEIKNQWSDCYEYINGEVYAVVYDNAFNAQHVLPFTTMDNIQINAFHINPC